MPSALELGVFGWLVAPILIAYFLSRTGRYESAHVLSSLSLTGLVTVVAWCTGGIGFVRGDLAGGGAAGSRALGLAPRGGAGLDASRSPPPDCCWRSARSACCRRRPTLGERARRAGRARHHLRRALRHRPGARRRAAHAHRRWLLNAEEERYRLLARNMTDVITRHGRNGAVLFVSPAAEPLFGVRAGELAGHGLFDRVHVADRPAYLTALADAAALGEDRSVEFRIRRDGDAEPLWRAFRLGRNALPPARSGSRGIRRARSGGGAARRERAQDRRSARSRSPRKESERINSAKSRFLATMSHELRTPLNAIIGFSDMLTNDSLELDAAREREYAKLINDSGRHLLSVVNGILDMSKMESGNFEITPEPFAPAPAITKLLRSPGAQGAGGGRRAQDPHRRRSAGNRRRPARGQSDPDQPHFQRHQVHAARRPRQRRARCCDGAQARGRRSRIPASASARTICRGWARPSSRRAPPTTAGTTAPASACRS